MSRPKGSKNKKTLARVGKWANLRSRADAWRKDRRFIAFLSLVLLIGLVSSLLYFKKHWVVVALVNNKPITSFEVIGRMYQTYRKEMTDQMVNERVVFNEARKQGAMPTEGEVKDKIAEIEERYGGKSEFEKILLENGQSRTNLEMNVRTLLAMEKMYGELVTVSDEEIEAYLRENSVEAVDEASRKEKAKIGVREKKLNQLYGQKFQELKEAANIRVF